MLTKAWADRVGRPVLALSVDHGLQPQSAAWTHTAEQAARRIGADFRALCWDGEKPNTGLPAAARAARHSLIADAARQAGASVILLGHTLDDQLENALMRSAGEPVGVLREWSPSPVWPQGRGLFHLRPLLTERRADLRVWLRAQGLSWIDDPANADMRSPRVRARAHLAQGAQVAAEDVGGDDEALRDLARLCEVTAWGGIIAPRAAFAPDAKGSLRLLQIAAACAAGRPALPRPERVKSVLERLNSPEPFVTTLGGARFQVGRNLFVTREAGEFLRAPTEPLMLEGGRPTVWDGRFELTARRDGLTARPLAGHRATLKDIEKSKLSGVSVAARGALPMVSGAGLEPTCPLLAQGADNDGEVTVSALIEHRFKAACGILQQEDENVAVAKVANGVLSSYVRAEAKGVFE